MTPLEEISRFGDVPVSIEVELGRPLLKVREILQLDAGTLIQLSRAAGENIDIRVGGTLIGYGEIVVTETLAGVRITDFKGED
jgi:flagellar motor switch protein FliN/FliY